ncbi:unnamed protein product [Pieris macdunnoughi]|uniref:Uncharacterized protein n=1 Tax=Pieris macdunnoughi TaxID=345717 RepID=A0A821YBK0_9NEOP|nr:unnamed protein product [Pieris macdunnoughi]
MDSNFNSLCRLCLKPNSTANMICLFDNNKVNYYGQAVLHFASIKLNKPDDPLPSSMCKMCLILLKQCIYFKFMCEASGKKLDEVKNKLAQVKFKYDLKLANDGKEKLLKPKMNESTYNMSDQDVNENSHDGDINDLNFTLCKTKKPQSKNVDAILDILENSIPLESDDRFDLSNYEEPAKLLNEYPQSTHKRMNISNIDKQRTCPICLKRLANPSSFWKHMRTHNKKHRLICEHCGMSFASFAGLNGHMVVIHGTGKYIQCQQCPFKASRRFEMKEHERIHTGERPFACEKCGLTFRRKEIYRKHLFIHSEKTVQCKECPKMFFTPDHMVGHYNTVHKRYMYMCYECGVLYAKNGTVRRHLLEKHGIPRKDQKKLTRVKAGDAI